MAKRKKGPPGEYEVGRGRPPLHSRFAPGQSGNPGGRRKGCRNLKTILELVLHSEIEITENGQRRTVEVVEALLKREVQEGLRGNLLAIRNALDRYERHTGSQAEHDGDVAEEDRAILERLIRDRNSTAGKRRRRSKQRGGGDE